MTTSTNKTLFLSAVSSEFESYRRLLADDLKRPTLDVEPSRDLSSLADRPWGIVAVRVRLELEATRGRTYDLPLSTVCVEADLQVRPGLYEYEHK